MSTRRQFIHGSLALGLGANTLTSSLWAQSAIEQVKVLYGFPAGSAGDVTARRVADRFANSSYAKLAGVVDNRPGAGGRLALEALRTANPDGATLAMTPFSALAIYPHIFKKLGYDPVKDFVPVSMSAVMHHGFAIGPVVPDSVRSLKDFLAWAKANPGLANYGSPGAGSTPHFLGALLAISSGIDMKHVPYRGSVPGVTDVVGGQIAAMCTPSGDFLQNHRAGKLRLIATSGPSRSPFSQDVATFAEQGFPELTTEEWFGFYAPARTPAAIVSAANATITSALKESSMIDGLGAIGLIARGSTPEQQAASLRTETDRWGPLVKKIGFTADS